MYTIKLYRKSLFALVILFVYPILGGALNLPMPMIMGVIVCSILLLSTDIEMLKKTFKGPIAIWSVLMLYHFVNFYVKTDGTYTLQDVLVAQVMTPIYIMSVTSLLTFINQIKTLKLLVIIYIVYLLVAMSVSSQNGLNFDGRLMSGSLHPNILGQTAGVACLFLALYYSKAKISFLKLCLFTFCFGIVLLTQSRNALILVVFSIISYVYSYLAKRGKFGVKTIILLSSFCILFYVLGDILLNETEVGGRILGAASGETSQVNLLYESGTIWDSILGERVMYYVIGFSLLNTHFLTGIGLWNFHNHNIYDLPFHTEYMIHLVEGGFIGFILYMTFIYKLFRLYYSLGKKRDIFDNQLFISLLGMALICFTAREFCYNYFFPLYGFIITSYKLKLKS